MTRCTQVEAGFLALTVSLAAGACGSSGNDAPAASASEAGAEFDAGVDSPPKGECVDTPTAANCLNDENTALFVAQTGSDAPLKDGTRANPYKTINSALERITSKKRRIYVCDGTYSEDITLTAMHSGVSIVGGVDCAWKPDPAIKPVIGGTANPLKFDGVTRVVIEDVAVVARDAVKGSSIAALVIGSEVSFKRVRLSAGSGANGGVGVRADFALPTDLNGNDGIAGGGEKLVACPGGLQTVGGKGGASGLDGSNGSPGPDNRGTLGQCASSSPTGGTKGAVGISPPAATGASTLGELTAQGWKPSAGHDGSNGGPGQGGGGGAGLGGGTGGGGGAGGCGGAGGGGGEAGGASIALVTFQSSIDVSESSLRAKDAGAGGAGAAGQIGTTAGGFGGGKASGTTACNGAAGGAGGAGAAGGGGAGGVSAGILIRGSKPTLDDATSKTIIFGMKGAAGAAGSQQAGIDGTALAVVELP